MGVLINFLIDNYIYFVFVAILLVLALIGYIVDSTKTQKLKKEFAKKEEEKADIPVANLTNGIKIGETVNKTAINANQTVKSESPTNNGNTPPVATKTDVKK